MNKRYCHRLYGFFKSKCFFCLLVVICLLPYSLLSQDLGAIGKDKKPIKFNGSISANQILYGVDGIENRRPPWNYFLSGNVSVNLYGWVIPFSFTYSNQKSQFQQPFNQYGIQPYYKWVKFYAGYTSMQFSPYSLNGHLFLGGGVQLTPPGFFRCSAMAGRLNRAIEEDTTQPFNVIPSYQRIGGGFKVGVGKGSDFVDAIFFTAKDDVSSLKKPIVKSDVQPAENVVLSLVASKQLFKKVVINGEYATSALTKDVRSEKSNIGNDGVFQLVPFFNNKTSTSFYNAYKANVNYTGQSYTIGAGYERIDPGYRTLGAYYFNDDLENITGNGSKRFLNGKLNIAANIGIQNNNLKGDKLTKMSRNIYAFNINFTPSPRVNFSAGYSNFQTYTNVRRLTPLEQNSVALDPKLNGNPDTLNFIQLSQSANFNTNYALGSLSSKERRSSLSLSLVYQTSGDARNNVNVQTGTHFYNGNISFNRSITPQALTFTFGFNANYNELATNTSTLLSPTASFSKGFFKKTLKPTASLSWTNSLANGRKISDIINFRLGCTYSIKKKHNFNTNFTIVKRQTQIENSRQKNFTEFTCNMGYTFNF